MNSNHNMDLEIDGKQYEISYSETERYQLGQWREGNTVSNYYEARITTKYVFEIPKGYDGLVLAIIPVRKGSDIEDYNKTNKTNEAIWKEGYAPLDKNDANYVEGTKYFRLNRNEDGLKAPRESPERTEPAIDAETGQLNYVRAESPSAPASAEDFIQLSSPDGAYSFMYPADYFYQGTYNEEDGSYYFETADNSVIVEFYETDAPVPGSPYDSAEKMYENLKGQFLEGAECPFVHRSKGVADDGYSRMIISGPYAEMTNGPWGAYYCTSSNDDTTYIMKIEYVTNDQNGTGVENSETGYLLDCLYRGRSLSGSTYEIRSYEQYLDHDMGSKKPGES